MNWDEPHMNALGEKLQLNGLLSDNTVVLTCQDEDLSLTVTTLDFDDIEKLMKNLRLAKVWLLKRRGRT